jgi:beta-phosphoglucomutase
MTKAFIFDLDGVIVYTAKFHFLAWKNLAESLDISFSEAENEQLKGVSRVRSLEKILDWGQVKISEERFNQLMAEKNQEYLSYVEQMTTDDILPGVHDTLTYLKEQDYPVALGSASKNARLILEKVNLSSFFDAIVDGNEVSKAKPNPEVFLKGCELLGVQPHQAVVFEDSQSGIEAANSAQMTSVGIGDAEVLNQADFNYSGFSEIDEQTIHNLSTFNKKN